MAIDAYGGNGADSSFYAVYDGHCGDEAAELTSQHLHVLLQKHMSASNDTKEAFEGAFAELDALVLQNHAEKGLESGTTAIVALITGEDAPRGDSR